MTEASLIETAVAAARAGGEVALASWRNLAEGSVSEKKKNDFVTDVDRESEERIVSRIRQSLPGDNFLGEEGGRRGADSSARTWIVELVPHARPETVYVVLRVKPTREPFTKMR